LGCIKENFWQTNGIRG